MRLIVFRRHLPSARSVHDFAGVVQPPDAAPERGKTAPFVHGDLIPLAGTAMLSAVSARAILELL
jgi:hypothetical protein